MTTEPNAALPTAAYKLMILAGLLSTFSVALGAAAWSYDRALTDRSGAAKPPDSGRAAAPVAARPSAPLRPTRVRTRSS